MQRSSSDSAFSRRRFLEGATAVGLLSAFGPGVLANKAHAQSASAKGVLTATHWGAVRADIENGKIVSLKPFEKDYKPSVALEGLTDVMYSSSRIKYPMVRAGYLKDGVKSDRTKRGAEEFVRVSWDQALDLVVKETQRVMTEHGPAGIYGGTYGWKSPGKFQNAQNALKRFLNLAGGHVASSGDYSAGASQVITPHVTGFMEVYSPQPPWDGIAKDSELVIMWGGDYFVTNEIGWLVPDHYPFEGMRQLKDAGKKVVVIDPVRTELVNYFKADHIAIRPHGDVPVMLALAHTLYTEKLHDQKFLDTYTVGFDRFLPYLLGTTDGQPKSAEWAEKLSDVPAETIKALARSLVKQRTMLMSGYALQRQHHGEQSHWMLIVLAAMVGQIGLPGGGFNLGFRGGLPSTDCPIMGGLSSGKADDRIKGSASSMIIPCARIVDMLENPNKPFEFNGKTFNYPDVRMCFWAGGNPFAHHQDRNRMVKAWQKFETVVITDLQWTATCRFADIVLPATSVFERNDIEQWGDTARGIVAMHKLVEPMFEARNDYEIFREMAKRIGKEAEFTESKSEMEWIQSFYDGTQAKTKTKMPSFQDFWNGDSYIVFPTVGAGYVRHKGFRNDPLLEPLGTPSGKIEIFSKAIEKMNYDDCKPHPMWYEPFEWLGSEKAKTYPLHVITKHPLKRLHSQLCGTKLRDDYAVSGREPIWINPKDAAERGLKDGDIVRVFNDRGQTLAGVKVTDVVREKCVVLCEGGWYDPEKAGDANTLCKYGDVNVLSKDVGTSRLAQANCGHTIIAQVEKYSGPALAVTAFSGPSVKA